MLATKKKVYIQIGACADSSFFKVFNYEFVHGNPEDALKEDNGIVLTEETASKLFGDKSAMGELVRYDDLRDYIVRGIVKEPESPKHFQFDMFMGSNSNEN